MTDRQATWMRVVLVVLMAVGAGVVWWLSGADAGLDEAPLEPRCFDQAELVSAPFQGLPEPLDSAEAWRVALPPDSLTRATVTLPRFRPAAVSGDPVEPQVSWYQVRYTAPAGTVERLVVYVPRVSGGSVQVARRQADQWLMRWDGTSQWREQWNRPVFVDIGPAPLAGESVDVAVGVRPIVGQLTSVSRICVGPQSQVRGRYNGRVLLQSTAPEVGSLTFVSLGLISLIFWFGRRVDRAYVLFGLTALAWAVRNLHYYIDMPSSPLLHAWFWWLSTVSLSWVMLLTFLFALRFDNRRFRGVELGLLGVVALATLVGMPMGADRPMLQQLPLNLVNGLVSLFVLGWLAGLVWHEGGRELRILTFALLITDLAGLHDLLLLQGRVSPESVFLLPLATLAIFAAFLFAVQTRYATAIWRVESANGVLEQRLAEREAELHANHELLRGIESEQALLLERQRLMRDMHDGLGSTLMSSLVLVEQGQLQSSAVAELLRECVDDLRLVIDSLEPIGHDLVTLLASLRYRLGQRLESAGLVMDWAVEDVPPLEWLNPPDALQVLRIVQEVLTNVLKHARARRVRIATHNDGHEIEVVIEDDGVGFDTEQASRGRGLAHLRQRATRLGGRVEIDSRPGAGTRVRLHLALRRGIAP